MTEHIFTLWSSVVSNGWLFQFLSLVKGWLFLVKGDISALFVSIGWDSPFVTDGICRFPLVTGDIAPCRH